MSKGELELTDEEIAIYLDETRGYPCSDFRDGYYYGSKYARDAQLAKATKYYEQKIAEAVKKERERIWFRLNEIDEIALDHKDFTRRVCNLIVEIKPEFLKGDSND